MSENKPLVKTVNATDMGVAGAITLNQVVAKLQAALAKAEADRDQALGVAAEVASDLRLAVMARETWQHIGAESASALARVGRANEQGSTYHAFGERVEYIIETLPPAPKALLDLVSAAVGYRGAVRAVNGIVDAEAALLAAVAAWQEELTKSE